MNSFLFLYPDDNQRPERKTAIINGVCVEYIEKDGICRAVRVVSSNPSDYLNAGIFPGADITAAVNSQKK